MSYAAILDRLGVKKDAREFEEAEGMEEEEEEAEDVEEEEEEEGSEPSRAVAPGEAKGGKGGGVVVPPASCLTQKGARRGKSFWKPARPWFREIVRAEARDDPPETGDMMEVRALARYALTVLQTAETEALIWESLARNQLMDVAESSNLARQLLAARDDGGAGLEEGAGRLGGERCHVPGGVPARKPVHSLPGDAECL